MGVTAEVECSLPTGVRLSSLLDVSPCGRWLASAIAGSVAAVQVFDLLTGNCLADLRYHMTPISGVAFSDVGLLSTVSFEGSLLAWKMTGSGCEPLADVASTLSCLASRVSSPEEPSEEAARGGGDASKPPSEVPHNGTQLSKPASDVSYCGTEVTRDRQTADVLSHAQAARSSLQTLLRTLGNRDLSEVSEGVVSELVTFLDLVDENLRPLLHPPHPAVALVRSSSSVHRTV